MVYSHTAEQPSSGDDAHAHYLGHLLWEVGMQANILGEAEMAGTALTLPSNGMLHIVNAEPGITIAEITRRMPKSQQAVSQIVARLEKLGFLERRLGRGRGVGLYVTDAGRVAGRQGDAAEARYEERLRELVGAERCAALRRLLEEARERLHA